MEVLQFALPADSCLGSSPALLGQSSLLLEMRSSLPTGLGDCWLSGRGGSLLQELWYSLLLDLWGSLLQELRGRLLPLDLRGSLVLE